MQICKLEEMKNKTRAEFLVGKLKRLGSGWSLNTQIQNPDPVYSRRFDLNLDQFYPELCIKLSKIKTNGFKFEVIFQVK